jgi:hypothetical protein
MRRICFALTMGLITIAGPSLTWGDTVLVEDRVVEIAQTLSDPTDLWVSPKDLTKLNGFVLKPEGACLDDICVPIQQSKDSDIFISRRGSSWVNATELADRIQQPYVADHEDGVWSLGVIPVQRSGFLRDGTAPDFTLPDWQGNNVSLSDFKGKKIMLLTWASW